ncbi:MAG TPA: argininosuccinate lyase [Firmicutes bacterium]|nr:argininosuccinate lyase [Bacillota bacterium]
MKRLSAGILFALVLLMVACGPALATSHSFTLINESSLDIYEIYISPSSSNDWEEDILEEDILSHGEHLKITFDYANIESWDLLIVDEDGNSISWEALNLLELHTIRIYNENNEINAAFD